MRWPNNNHYIVTIVLHWLSRWFKLTVLDTIMSQTRIFHCLIVNLLICRGEASLPTAKHDSWVPESVRVQPKAACQRQPFAKSLGQSKALRHDVAVTVTKPAQLSQNAERLRSCRKLRGKCHEDHNPQCQIFHYVFPTFLSTWDAHKTVGGGPSSYASSGQKGCKTKHNKTRRSACTTLPRRWYLLTKGVAKSIPGGQCSALHNSHPRHEESKYLHLASKMLHPFRPVLKQWGQHQCKRRIMT